jgi:hypothetical protein
MDDLVTGPPEQAGVRVGDRLASQVGHACRVVGEEYFQRKPPPAPGEAPARGPRRSRRRAASCPGHLSG